MKRLAVALVAAITLALGATSSHAGSATWNLDPTSGDWNTAANWIPNTVPGIADTATFAVSNQTNVSVSTYYLVGGVVFSPGANSYEITSLPGQAVGFETSGISNQSGVIQNFVAATDSTGQSGRFDVRKTSTTGDSALVVFTAEAPTVIGGSPGFVSGTLTLSGTNVVTIGTGSGAGTFLEPGVGASKPTTLTIQADGTYTYKLNTKKAKADQVIANGVTIESGAQFNFAKVANKKLAAGTVFAVLSNIAATPIAGTFANLPDGSTFSAGRNNFQVNYSGGDGNDLT
jgi:hypothetical protein